MRVLRRLLLACTVMVAGCAAVAPGERAGAPKNIIILFADGTAPTQWEFGRFTARALRNESFAVTDVVLRDGVIGLLSTYSLDSFVTDSAAAASAMSTGHKVNNFAVSTGPDGSRYGTLMQAAKAHGKRIGLVTTATVYDASPAAFSVNAADRGNAQSIVDQYLQLGPDVLLGGGADYFLPSSAGGKRKDGTDVIAAFAGRGWQVVRDTAALKAATATATRLLGLFADEDMDFELDRDAAKEPSTAEMTTAALKTLARDNADGFVLFVENENTDAAGHLNDAAALMHALWAFDRALQVALEFQRGSPDTLVIVASDHETGGLSPTYALRDLSSTSSKNRFNADIEHLKMLDAITLSIGGMIEQLGTRPDAATLDRLVARHYPGFKLDADLREAILKKQPLERNFSNAVAGALSRMVSRQSGVYWGTAGHTSEPVVIGAIGPGAGLFRGYQDNTQFAQNLRRLLAPR
jgi:alkaline phosphatase